MRCFACCRGAEDATGVIVTWFEESGDEVTLATLIAEVGMDKVDVRHIPKHSGWSPCSLGGTRRSRRGGDRIGHLTLCPTPIPSCNGCPERKTDQH